MEENRQAKRFNPLKSDHYYDLNLSLSEELTKLKSKFYNKKILDIGAGEIPFSEYYKGLNVETVDIQQNSQNTIDHIMDVDGTLPFKDNSFDVIFIFDVLEHVQNDTIFIKECNRILNSGGFIISNTPFMYRFHEEPYDFRRYTPSGLKYIFETVGEFDIQDITPIGSLFFCSSKMLLEKDFNLSFSRKIVYKLIVTLLITFKLHEEVSYRSPFSYFVYAIKN